MTLATRRSVHRPDPRASPDPSAAAPAGVDEADGAPSAGAEARHGRRRAARPRDRRPDTGSPEYGASLTFALSTVALLAIAGGGLLAWLAAPSHLGPLNAPATLALVLATAPLVFLAALRLSVRVGGALVAAALSTLLQITASSDVVGVVEHLAIVSGLLAVVVWPRAAASVRRRALAGALTGAAVAVSPFALVASALVVALLLLRPSTRSGGPRALVLPAVVAVAVAAVLIGTMTLVQGGPDARSWLGATSWAGAFSLATFVVAAAPAIGVAAGMALDASRAAVRRRDAGELTVGVIGILAVVLLLAATLGGSIAQVRDRMIAADLDPDASLSTRSPLSEAGSAGALSDSEAATDPATQERAAQGAQLLQNPRLSTTAASRDLLAEGAVDARIMIVLAQLLTVHDLTVAGFPASADSASTEADGSVAVRRQVLVSAADGSDLQTGGGAIPTLTAYLSGLDDDFAVESVSVDADGVLATFAPLTSSPTPSPAGAP